MLPYHWRREVSAFDASNIQTFVCRAWGTPAGLVTEAGRCGLCDRLPPSFGVLTAAFLTFRVIWHVTPCSWASRRFGPNETEEGVRVLRNVGTCSPNDSVGKLRLS
jgi:hypothetical protein